MTIARRSPVEGGDGSEGGNFFQPEYALACAALGAGAGSRATGDVADRLIIVIIVVLIVTTRLIDPRTSSSH